MSEIEAGWYPDPENPALEWYWDGINWSGESRPVTGAPPMLHEEFREDLSTLIEDTPIDNLSSWGGVDNSEDRTSHSSNYNNPDIAQWSTSPVINESFRTQGQETVAGEDFTQTPYVIRKKEENKLRKKPFPVRLIVTLILFLSISLLFIWGVVATKKIKTQESVFGTVKIEKNNKDTEETIAPTPSPTPKPTKIKLEVSTSGSSNSKDKSPLPIATPTKKPTIKLEEKKSPTPVPSKKTIKNSNTPSASTSNSVTGLRASISNKTLVVSWLDPLNPSAGKVQSYTVIVISDRTTKINVKTSSAIIPNIESRNCKLQVIANYSKASYPSNSITC